MDTVFILQSTLATVQGICSWIERSHSKQVKLRQLKQTIQSLTMVLDPLRPAFESGTLDKTLVALLYDAAEILNGIKEHLALWSGKTKKIKLVTAITMVYPSVALGMLHDDERRLAQWINLFTLSLQIVTLKEQAGSQKQTDETGPKLTLDTDWIIPGNEDVASFWTNSFGVEVSFLFSLGRGIDRIVVESFCTNVGFRWCGAEMDWRGVG